MERLRILLKNMDGRGYKAYKDIEGKYSYPGFDLHIDHVQGDPFAEPSRIRLFVAPEKAAIPDFARKNAIRRLALEDFAARGVARAIQKRVRGHRGSGRGGEMRITTSGQRVLRRNALLVDGEGGIEARLSVGLPAHGRRIAAGEARDIFFRELPQVVADACHFKPEMTAGLTRHLHSVEDQHFLRHWIEENHLVAFIADGSHLPRRSGVDDRPLENDVLPFNAPESLAREVTLPNAGRIRGLALPRGITLIVGGGFHGKSTLLQALERGVYDHIPGDGRERVVCPESAVKIRAEDGRPVSVTDISPFINNLPTGIDTRSFTTENASGSTSQAANIMEALACGCTLLLLDEDTSATNFMIRDRRMAALVEREREPITPLLHRVRELHEKLDVSTIVVTGGSGDYFSVADTVLMMDAYRPRDVTTRAKTLAAPLAELMAGVADASPPFKITGKVPPPPQHLDPARGKRGLSIKSSEPGRLSYGRWEIDLARVEQLLDRGQTLAVGYLLHHYARHYRDRCPTLEAGLAQALEEVEQKGLDLLTPWIMGGLALPRLHELAAAVNRMRRLSG